MKIPRRQPHIRPVGTALPGNVLVTGSASGLGFCLAELLSEAGHYVAGVDTMDEGYTTLQADITKESDSIASRLPNTAILINCAGINRIAYLEDLEREDWDRVMDVNAYAPWAMTRALLPHKALRTVVNITSNAAWMPMTSSLIYNASKAAIHMITRQMARELTPRHGLTIFAVAPNKLAGTEMSHYIESRVPELRGWTSEEAAKYQRQSLMKGEETDPWEVAEFITFLLSAPHRHQHLSGCILPYGA